MSAFELITSRIAWYASEAISKYTAVEIGTDGKFAIATGARQFIGITAYECSHADETITVVKGAFPAKVSEAIAVGDQLTIGATPGEFVKATTGKKVYGTALTGAAIGELCTILTNDVAITV